MHNEMDVMRIIRIIIRTMYILSSGRIIIMLLDFALISWL